LPFFCLKQKQYEKTYHFIGGRFLFVRVRDTKTVFAEVSPDTITKIETKTVTEWRDTTIYVHLPGDSVFVNVPIPMIEPLNIPKLTARLPLARSTAWVDDGLLNLGLWLDSTTYKFKLDSANGHGHRHGYHSQHGHNTNPGTGSKAVHNNHLGVGGCRGCHVVAIVDLL
jgi:hypothetical protein